MLILLYISSAFINTMLPDCNPVPVHVIPKSSRERIDGWVADADGRNWLKVRVTVAPEDGKANRAVLKLLAKAWKIPASSLEIVSGETSRHKLIKILK